MDLQFRYCTSTDGTRIAYATYGRSKVQPLFVILGWPYDQQSLWQLPEGRAFLEEVGEGRALITHDLRGTGASQRDIDILSLEAHVEDIAAVVDDLGIERFDALTFSNVANIGMVIAGRRPDRVSRLVLSYPRLREDGTQSLIEAIRTDWSLARRAFAAVVYPNGPTEMQRWWSNMLRDGAEAEMAIRYLEGSGSGTSIDQITDILRSIEAPTLVVGDRGSGDSGAIAGLIRNARLVLLPGVTWYWNRTPFVEAIRQFLDEGRKEVAGGPASSGLHTVLFTDIESSTALTQRLGDEGAQELVRAHDAIVREALAAHGGSEIKHTGDGIMASFPTASAALSCAVAIQQGVAAGGEPHLRVHIGLNAGEPVAEAGDLFGTTVQLARRICDHASGGEIVVANVVRELAAGKGFAFADLGSVALKGFEEPVRLFELVWHDGAPARRRYPDGLTAREVEVLRLVAAGKSNREIADALVLSARTVERHITNIYGKIGARNKADAATYVAERGLR